MHALASWFERIGTFALVWSLVALVAIDLAAAAVLLLRRDRALVQRWTGPVLAANIALVTIGAGVPMMSFTGRLAVGALATMLPAAAAAEQPTDAVAGPR